MSSKQYFDGEYLTEEALLVPALLEKCGAATTNPRAIPKDRNIKNSDVIDYYTRNVRIVYPNSATSTTMIIPDVVIYHEVFQRYDKSNVYVGIPQTFVRWLQSKLALGRVRCNFDDQGVSSDDKYWWTCCPFSAAEEEKEYIFIVEEDEDEIVETPFASFTELFIAVGSSVVVNLTCSIKMSAKIEVSRKGAINSDDEWRMGVNLSRANVMDTIEISKPRNSVVQKSVAGKADKAKPRLLERLKQRQAARTV